jgi:hypothetical protein
MATLSTRELSKQPKKHEPPERVRKKNQENDQRVWSIRSTHRTIIADPFCSRGIPKYSSLRGKTCNLLIKHPEWKNNQWCKQTKSFTEFQNGASPEKRTLLHKPPELLAIELNDSSTPRTGIRGSLEISGINCSGGGFEATLTTIVVARKRTWTTERSCPSVHLSVEVLKPRIGTSTDAQTHRQRN